MRQNYMQGGRLADGNRNFQNAQDQLYGGDNVQGVVRGKTHLIQIYCDDPSDAPRLISEPNPNGVPIMVIIENPGSLVCKLDIPNGMYTLEQVWGVKQGVKEPGCDPCYCGYKEICVMISKNTIRFRTPIAQIPTKDNVRVTMDIGINFHIGHNEDEAQYNIDTQKFFYNFGPNRLEELLSEDVDEEIRSFVKGIKVAKVRDVKTELTTAIRESLQTKFEPYGIIIESVTVMNVILPRDLRENLMHTTNYDVYLQKQVKQHNNRILTLQNSENKLLNKLVRENKLKLMDEEHDRDLAEIEKNNCIIEMETQQTIKKIAAEKRSRVKEIEANNIKTLAELRAETEALAIVQKAEAYSKKQYLSADNEAKVIRSEADARLAVAKDRTSALIKESDAEVKQGNNMEGMRRHKEKMTLVGGMTTMASKQKMVVAGNNGQKVLEFYNSTVDLVQKR